MVGKLMSGLHFPSVILGLVLCGVVVQLLGPPATRPVSRAAPTPTTTSSTCGRRGPPAYLDNGWDTTASQIYNKVTRDLVKGLTAETENTKSGTADPLQSVRYVDVPGVPGYKYFLPDTPGTHVRTGERFTFAAYLSYLDASTTLVDFGTWIGYTLMYGAQMSYKAYGVEADPAAYAVARMNVLVNQDETWGKRVHLQAGCVGSNYTSKVMESNHPGNSCSGIGDKSAKCAGGLPAATWSVQCYTLPFLFQHWGLAEDPSTFVKIDVESYECELLPSLQGWLKGLGELKPTLFVAFHDQIDKCSDTQYAAIAEIASLYRTVVNVRGHQSALDDQGQLRVRSGEVIFTDRLSHHGEEAALV